MADYDVFGDGLASLNDEVRDPFRENPGPVRTSAPAEPVGLADAGTPAKIADPSPAPQQNPFDFGKAIDAMGRGFMGAKKWNEAIGGPGSTQAYRAAQSANATRAQDRADRQEARQAENDAMRRQMDSFRISEMVEKQKLRREQQALSQKLRSQIEAGDSEGAAQTYRIMAANKGRFDLSAKKGAQNVQEQADKMAMRQSLQDMNNPDTGDMEQSMLTYEKTNSDAFNKGQNTVRTRMFNIGVRTTNAMPLAHKAFTSGSTEDQKAVLDSLSVDGAVGMLKRDQVEAARKLIDEGKGDSVWRDLHAKMERMSRWQHKGTSTDKNNQAKQSAAALKISERWKRDNFDKLSKQVEDYDTGPARVIWNSLAEGSLHPDAASGWGQQIDATIYKAKQVAAWVGIDSIDPFGMTKITTEQRRAVENVAAIKGGSTLSAVIMRSGGGVGSVMAGAVSNYEHKNYAASGPGLDKTPYYNYVYASARQGTEVYRKARRDFLIERDQLGQPMGRKSDHAARKHAKKVMERFLYDKNKKALNTLRAQIKSGELSPVQVGNQKKMMEAIGGANLKHVEKGYAH